MSADFADRARANYDVESIEREYDAMLKPPRREDAAGAGHHAPHAKRFAVGGAEECAIGSYVRFEDYEGLRRQYDATAEGYRAALSTAERDVKRLDWMQAHTACVGHHRDTNKWWSRAGRSFATLREAIDAAMRKP